MPSTNTILLRLELESREARQEIAQLRQQIAQLGGNTNDSTDRMSDGFGRVRNTASSLTNTIKGLASAYLGLSVLQSTLGVITEFETSMTRVKAVSGANAEEFAKLSERARELGASTEYTAGQVAEAMSYMAMAGVSINDTYSGVENVLDLARIGMIDLGTASDIATNIMSGFGMTAKELPHVIDVMATTITNSNTNIQQMGEAMKYVAPVSKMLGVSIEETSTAIGLLGSAGLQGSEAGTTLNAMMLALTAQTSGAKTAIDGLGISVYDASGKFVGIEEALRRFQVASKNLTDEQKANAYKDIFGVEALKGANILIDSVGNEFTKLNDKIMNAQGKAKEMSQIMAQTLAKEWANVVSAVQEVALSIGDELLPALTELAKMMANGVRNAKEFYDEYGSIIKTITELAVAMYGLQKAGAILGLIFGAGALAQLGSFSAAMVLLATRFRVFIALITTVNPIFALLAVSMGAFLYKMNEIEEATNRINKSTKSFVGVMNESDTVFDAMVSTYDKASNTFIMTQKQFEDMGSAVGNQIVTLEESKKALEKLIKQSEFGSDEWKAYTEQLNQVIRKQENLTNSIVSVSTFIKITQEDVKVLEKTWVDSMLSVSRAIEEYEAKINELGKDGFITDEDMSKIKVYRAEIIKLEGSLLKLGDAGQNGFKGTTEEAKNLNLITKDIGDSAKKAIEDINRLTDSYKTWLDGIVSISNAINDYNYKINQYKSDGIISDEETVRIKAYQKEIEKLDGLLLELAKTGSDGFVGTEEEARNLKSTIKDMGDEIKESEKEAKKAIDEFAESFEVLGEKGKKALEKLKDGLDDEIASNQNAINSILSSRIKLEDDLAKLIQERFKIEVKYGIQIADLDRKVLSREYELRQSGLTDHEKYLQNKKQAEDLFARARESIRNDDFDTAKKLNEDALALVQEYAGKEIAIEHEVVRLVKDAVTGKSKWKQVKEKEVLATKEETAKAEMDLLDDYHAIELATIEEAKRLETDAHIEKINAKIDEIEMLNIELRTRLTIAKSLAQLSGKTTDVKINSDLDKLAKEVDDFMKVKLGKLNDQKNKVQLEMQTTAFDRSHDNVNKRLKALAENRPTVEFHSDTKNAEEGIKRIDWSIEEVNQDLDETNNNIEIVKNQLSKENYLKVVTKRQELDKLEDDLRLFFATNKELILSANDSDVKTKFLEMKDRVNVLKEDITDLTVTADTDEAKLSLDLLSDYANNSSGVFKVDSDNTKAVRKVQDLSNKVEDGAEYFISANTLEAFDDVNNFVATTSKATTTIATYADTTNADGSIDRLITQIDGTQTIVSVDSDTTEARVKLDTLTADVIFADPQMNIRADSGDADIVIGNIASSIGSIDGTVKIMTDITDATQKINSVDAMKPIVEVGADGNEIAKVADNIASLSSITPIITVDANIERANAKLNEFKNFANMLKTQSLHTVGIDATNAFNAINTLKQSTFSTHTIIVKTVGGAYKNGGIIAPIQLPRFELGGSLDNGIGHTRKQGKLAGFGGGDKIKALLEAGEFIVRKEAVAKIGIKTMDRINQGIIPRFAEGGIIQSATINKSVDGNITDNIAITINTPEYKDAIDANGIQTSVNEVVDNLSDSNTLLDNSLNAFSSNLQNDVKKVSNVATDSMQKLVDNSKTAMNNLSNMVKKSTEAYKNTTAWRSSANFYGSGFNGQEFRFAKGGIAGIDTSKGGKLAGFGGGDRIPALLEAGEFIIRKEAVAKVGVNMFKLLNDGIVPRFAEGGFIGNSSIPAILKSNKESASKSVVDVNFKMPDGQVFALQGESFVVDTLQKYLRRNF